MIKKDDCLFIDMKGSPTCKMLESCGIKVFEPYEKRMRMAYKIRYGLHLTRLENFFNLCSSVNPEILDCNPQKMVILSSLIYEPFIKNIRKYFPTTRIIYVYNNIVNSRASLSPHILHDYAIEGWSWDRGDCERFGIHYLKPSYNKSVLPQYMEKKYDVCFIGKDKGRFKTINQLRLMLEAKGFTCYVKITPNYSFLLHLHSYYSEPITYSEYLDVISSSQCIIDLVQDGQTGTTLRVFEALFNQKKLITNNAALMEYDFYKEQNIFILGKDPIERIESFLTSEYEPVNQDVLDGYSVEQWIKTLIND